MGLSLLSRRKAVTAAPTEVVGDALAEPVAKKKAKPAKPPRPKIPFNEAFARAAMPVLKIPSVALIALGPIACIAGLYGILFLMGDASLGKLLLFVLTAGTGCAAFGAGVHAHSEGRRAWALKNP